MNPPRQYSEWVACLASVEKGDDQAIALLESGTFNWEPGVADRLFQHLVRVIQARVQRAGDLLSRDLQHSDGGASSVTAALVGYRRAIGVPLRLVSLSILPVDLSTSLKQTISKQMVDTSVQIQRSLSRLGPQAYEALRAVKGFDWAAVPQTPSGGSRQQPAVQETPAPRGRRVILPE